MVNLNLVIKTTNGDKFNTLFDSELTVLQLKEHLGKEHGVPAYQHAKLIYKGHVLKDDKTIASYDIQDAQTIILVKSAAKKPQTSSEEAKAASPVRSTPAVTAPSTIPPATTTPAPISAAPSAAPAANPFASLMGNPMFAGAAAGTPNMADMQRQLMENPEMMQSIMDSPMMQSLLDNPELMQTMFQSNPQIRALMERNPEMAHLLNDPAIIRQSMEIARNPELMREMMRNTDRAMSNIEAHPEGFNALRRMYENVQEPMMNAASGSGNSAPSNTVINQDNSNTPSEAAPIPNPWAPASSASSAASSAPAGASASANANPFAALSGLGGLGANPMAMSPEQMTQMLENPFVQQMMTSMMSNPEMLESMISSNPATRQMLDSNPQMREMLRNPEFLRMAADPQTMRTMLQMQSAMNAFRNLAPPSGSGSSASTSSTASSNTASSSSTAPNPYASFFGAPASNAGAASNPYAALFGAPASGAASNPYASLFNMGPYGSGSEALRPEILYREQLAQLNSMGFTNAEANINALVQTGGNIEAAVNRLLGL